MRLKNHHSKRLNCAFNKLTTPQSAQQHRSEGA